MSQYDKPLAHGGHRIIGRSGAGRFAKTPSLGADVCSHCGGIILPETVDVGTKGFPFMRTIKPTKCLQCGAALGENPALDQREVAAGYDRFYTTIAQQLDKFGTWREAKRAIVEQLKDYVSYGREHQEPEALLVGIERLIADVRKAKAFSDLRRSDGERWLVEERRWVEDNPSAKLVRQAEQIIRELEDGR